MKVCPQRFDHLATRGWTHKSVSGRGTRTAPVHNLAGAVGADSVQTVATRVAQPVRELPHEAESAHAQVVVL